MNFISIQSSHWTPTVTTDKSRVRTGYERIIAHRCGKIFAGTAAQNGTVTAIDEKTKVAEVTYKDGSREIFPYGEQYVPFQGFYATHHIENIVKVGQKLKKGDIITYNKGFFTLDKSSKQLDMTIGNRAMVAFVEMDVNLEDAACISQRLADKLNIEPTNTRTVTLSKNSLIHYCANIGDKVKNIDKLMVFEEDPGLGDTLFQTASDETQNLLGELNRKIPNAKHSGTIVKIEAHYGCTIAEMHPSLANIVRTAVTEQNRLAKMAAGTKDEEDYPPNAILPDGLKYNGITYDKDTVAITFYIKDTEQTRPGDKLILGNLNKLTISSLMEKTALTEDGKEIDVLFSSDSCGRRIVLSPYYLGILENITKQMETNILDMYFS